MVALLGPMAILATLAGVALFRDWRAAQFEAAEKAHDVAENVANALVGYLDSTTDRPTALPLGITPPKTGFVIDASQQLRRPAALVWPPYPVPLGLERSSELRALWDRARAVMARGAGAEAVEAYDGVVRWLSANTLDASPAGREPSSMGVRWRRLALWERAIALEQAGRPDELMDAFQAVLGDFPWRGSEAPTESGIDVACLAALRILENADGDFTKLPEVWRTHASELAEVFSSWPPSPYLESIAEAMDGLSRHPEGQALWLRTLRLSERLKEFDVQRTWHATAVRELGVSKTWPATFWLGRMPDNLVVAGWELPASLAYQVRSEPGRTGVSDPALREFRVAAGRYLRDMAAAAAGLLDRRRDFTLEIRVAGELFRVKADSPKAPPPAGLEKYPLARVQRTFGDGAEVEIRVGYTDPVAFFGSLRRRQFSMVLVLVAAVAMAVVATWATGRALARQQALNLEKSNFVSSVSHELRAPLGSIRLLAEGLERGTLSGESAQKEYFRLIGQETRRLGALVENVLDFSRIEQGRKQYEMGPTDLAALVRDTVKLAERSASTRDLLLDLVGLPENSSGSGEPGWEIEADGRAIQQALVNLIDNATKHAPAGSRIEVRVDASNLSPDVGDGFVDVSVSDSGPGIPEEDHERIFEPFYRRGSELRRETEGVGIGLSIVRHILESHGGRVLVVSSPGQGATFTLRLPRGKRSVGDSETSTSKGEVPAPTPASPE